jgi:L-ascorbate metabolism protein UlaG (beta-lactamase superfamily)
LIPAASKAKIVAPKSVAEKLPSGSLADRATVVAAGDKIDAAGVPIEAVPAYNITPERQSFHPKGRDVGYVIQLGGKRIYIAGDTEDIPEMRKLKNVDAAFLPMNLPFTMDIEQAANAAREFKPKILYPYHFRSRDKTKPDFDKLKKLIGADSGVEVRVLKWY